MEANAIVVSMICSIAHPNLQNCIFILQVWLESAYSRPPSFEQVLGSGAAVRTALNTNHANVSQGSGSY